MQFLPDGVSPNESDTVQAVTTAVTHVAVALDELKNQLEIANRRVGDLAAAQITEAELGRLFVRAGAFADTVIAEAQDEARQVVDDANQEAQRILADARGDADAIIEEAERSTALPPAVVVQVQAALDGFTQVNAELTEKLEFLRGSLQPQLTPSTTTARAETGSPTEVAPATLPPATLPPVTTGSEWRAEKPEVPESTSAPTEVTSLDSLLAGAWRPASAAGAQPRPLHP